MEAAILHATERKVAVFQERPEGAEFEEDVIEFADGTAIAVRSMWNFISKETGTETESPRWRIYK